VNQTAAHFSGAVGPIIVAFRQLGAPRSHCEGLFGNNPEEIQLQIIIVSQLFRLVLEAAFLGPSNLAHTRLHFELLQHFRAFAALIVLLFRVVTGTANDLVALQPPRADDWSALRLKVAPSSESGHENDAGT
jgi:hypothetical protein